MSSVDRYLKQWITLSDGRRFYGRRPGTSGVVILEHALRDDLARLVRGVTEAVLPYGRVDVMTAESVIEVESAGKWRQGIRQALSYSAQTGLPPSVALFGAAHRDQVLKIYMKLRDGSPAIGLWWHSGHSWARITARRCCVNMRTPDRPFSTDHELPMSYDLEVS